MEAIVAGALALAAYLVTRALLVEGRAPASVWRDATFGKPQQPRRSAARVATQALRARSSLDRIGQLIPNLDRMQAPAQRMVEAAGLSPRLSGTSLIGICAVLGATFAFFGLLMTAGAGWTSTELLALPVVGLLGAAAPIVVVSGRGQRRRDAIDRSLPDVLDLLVVSVEAGLALEGALQRVSYRANGPLTQEIQRTLNEIALGRRRYDALLSLASRSQVQPLTTLVNAMNQAERTGMHLGPVLRAQAEQIRTRRRQVAEEKAMKAPLKMLFPLAFFIFPAMFLVIMGPAVIPFFD